MGVYIDMEMPKNCEKCLCRTKDAFGGLGCQATGYIPLREANQDRPDWCPLIPVPKHGRLIDGDAVSDILEKEITMAGKQIMLFELTGDIKNKNRMRAMQIEKVCCRRLLDSMPTIIEAEEGEE